MPSRHAGDAQVEAPLPVPPPVPPPPALPPPRPAAAAARACLAAPRASSTMLRGSISNERLSDRASVAALEVLTAISSRDCGGWVGGDTQEAFKVWTAVSRRRGGDCSSRPGVSLPWRLLSAPPAPQNMHAHSRSTVHPHSLHTCRRVVLISLVGLLSSSSAVSIRCTRTSP